MKRYLHLFTALALLVVAVSNAHATQTGETTLGFMLEDPSHRSVTAGDKRFDSWSYTGGVDPDFFQIVALSDGGLDPGPGLRFNVLNNALAVFDDESRSVTIGFRVTVLDPGLYIKDVSMSLTGFNVSGEEDQAGISITERVGTTSGANDLANLLVSAYDPGVNTLTDSDGFAGRSEIWVTKQIFLFADDFDDSASLTSFEQRFSQEPVPEPVTAGLGMMGLAALALAATRRRIA